MCAAGGASVPARLATDVERDADETVKRLVADAQPGRFLVFRTERPLPADSTVTVTVSRGTPSAEGPRRTVEDQSWSFRTYGPFRVKSHECGWGGRCAPFQPWRIELTNPVDAKTLRKDSARVEPELPGLKLETWGDSIAINGMSRGRTTYRVTLSNEIRDVFGQALEAHPPLSFAVGPAEAMLSGPSKDLRRARSRRPALRAGVLGQPAGAASARLRGGAGALGGVERVPAARVGRGRAAAARPARDRHDPEDVPAHPTS